MKRTTKSGQNMIRKSWFITGLICSLFLALVAVGLSFFAGLRPELQHCMANGKSQPVPITDLEESIHHALMKYEGGKPLYQRYSPDQSIHIADNLLLWQNHDGGWPKNVDWLKILTKDDLDAMPSFKKSKSAGSTLDNKNIWAQIDFLVQVRSKTRLKRYDNTINRAIDYLIDNQHLSGGWRGADVDAITFNDDVMTGVIRTLKQVTDDDALYGFVSTSRRESAQQAYKKGIGCILKCQIRTNGKLTAWAQQHDHKTFRPVKGRRYEFSFPVTRESVSIVTLLMEIDRPDRKIIQAIESAVNWLNTVKIEGLLIREVPADPIQYRYHWTDFDRVEVHEQGAPPIWARFYDPKHKKPAFANREKQIVWRYQDLTRERRTGYEWYGYWPARLLQREYPAWRNKINRANHE
ncbi:MAG: pectate lyase [Smithella sp.]|jgi:PelA/Pel-15E family pectate lyase